MFLSLAEARQIIEARRYDYNHLRPQGSVGALILSELAVLEGQETQPPQEVMLVLTIRQRIFRKPRPAIHRVR